MAYLRTDFNSCGEQFSEPQEVDRPGGGEEGDREEKRQIIKTAKTREKTRRNKARKTLL
jgi:hypothetical protein